MMNDSLFSVLFFGIWALVGTIFLIVSLIMRRVNRNRQEKCTARASGVIADVEYRRSRDGGAYYPVVEFTAKGEVIRVRSRAGSNPPRYHGGESVQVFYDPDKPERFVIEGDNTMRIVEKVFLFVGLGCILVGSLVAYIAERMA